MNSVNFGFGWRSVSCFRPLTLLRPTCSFVLDHGRTIEIVGLRAECPDFARLIHCFANFWWRVLLSCRLTRPDLNSVQLSIALKDGVLWRLRGRISSFWTSPGRFPCIIAMSKSGVGDVSMRTTPGVALRGGKPRRKYFSSLHLTRWTDHLEPKTFILALNRMTTSPAVLLNESQRLRGIIWMDYCPLAPVFELCSRVNNLRHRLIFKTHRVSCVYPEPGMSTEPVLDASCQCHCRKLLGSRRQSRKVGESEQRGVS